MSCATQDALHHHGASTGLMGDLYPPKEAPRGFVRYMRVPQRFEGVVFKYVKHIPTV